MATETKAAVNSIPALAAAMRTTGDDLFAPPPGKSLTSAALVPMYRVRNGSAASETEDAVRLVEHAVDRLRRLADAYGAWQDFDAGAYFDLSERQVHHLVKVTERVSTVHVIFRTDLLLPTFRRAASYWTGQFVASHAAFLAGYGADAARAYDDDFLLETQPAMADHWQRLLALVEEVRAALADDPGFLGFSAMYEAQMSMRRFWTVPPVRGIVPTLTPDLAGLPTLTLAYDFPLPAHRQPDRVRRLRTNRDRRRQRSGRFS